MSSEIRKYITLLENAETLNEGLSPILFHATSITNMESIISDNEFTLSLNQLPHEHYYMSFSRNKTNGFIPYLKSLKNSGDDSESFDPNHDSFVVLKLDGKKLAANYKGVPMNAFFGPEDNDDDDPYAQEMRDYARLNSFQEDRIISMEPKIPNASKYIMEVHIILTDEIDPYDNDLIERLNKLTTIKIYGNVDGYIKNDEYDE